MLRPTIVLGTLGIALVLGVAPGCDSDDGAGSVAVDRFFAALDSTYNTVCACAVAQGQVASQEACLAAIEALTGIGATFADRECVRQAVGDNPDAVPGIECAANLAEQAATCVANVTCTTDESPYVACLDDLIQGLDACPDLPADVQAALNACFNFDTGDTGV
jgi:hypothetical protein